MAGNINTLKIVSTSLTLVGALVSVISNLVDKRLTANSNEEKIEKMVKAEVSRQLEEKSN